MCDINAPFFNDEDAAREYLEAQRWEHGRFCPHCGGTERTYPVKPQKQKSKEKKDRKGIYQCNDCRKQFTVTVGTIFERSKIKLHKWLMATYLMSSSKKGISAKQIERALGVTYKTAWFMCHRIREAMREQHELTGKINDPGKMGGEGSVVEADETFVGRTTTRKGEKKRTVYSNKEKVLTLVERGGRARSFHVPAVNAKTLRPIMLKQLHQNSTVYTDDAVYHRANDKFFKHHDSVNHSAREYVRGDVHTQTIENFFSILKRGINGVYQHCSEQHLKRYLGEYDFRYNYREKLGYDDLARTNFALKGIEGKRLMYRDSSPVAK